jgi:hypothetical protein
MPTMMIYSIGGGERLWKNYFCRCLFYKGIKLSHEPNIPIPLPPSETLGDIGNYFKFFKLLIFYFLYLIELSRSKTKFKCICYG